MKTWYIVDEDDNSVWCHHRPGNKSCGLFDWDVDAMYRPEHFSYRTQAAANRRMQAIVADERAKGNWVRCRVFDREQLFALLEVNDWAFPNLNDAPDPKAEERERAKEAKRQARVNAKAASAVLRSVVPPANTTPVFF